MSTPKTRFVAAAAIVLSLASAAFTVYWYHWKYQKELDAPPPGERPRVVPKVDMVPWVQPDGGGLAGSSGHCVAADLPDDF